MNAIANSSRTLVITNLYPNPVEPTRSTFNEQQVAALARCTSLAEVVAPIDWRRRLSLRTRWKDAPRRGTVGQWNGLPTSWPTYYYVPRVLRWLNGPLMALSLLAHARRLRRLRPSAIFATWAYPDVFAAAILGALWKIPLVAKVHGSDVEMLAEGGLRRRLALWGLRRASRVVAVSAYLRDRLVEHGLPAAHIAILYNGIDRTRFRPRDRSACRAELGIPPGAPLLLFAGNLKEDKGSVDMLLAAEGLCRAGEARLAFAGDGPERQRIEAMVAERGLGGAVTMLGRLPHDRLPLWMGAADAVCLPSHHEGVPNVLLEATACGVPVVATTVGGVPEVVGPKNGRLAPPHDPAAFERAIREVLAKEWNAVDVAQALFVPTWDTNAATIAGFLEEAQRP